jgi:hypothetical protein
VRRQFTRLIVFTLLTTAAFVLGTASGPTDSAVVSAAGLPSRYEPVQPCRLADERVGTGFIAVDPYTARVSTSACRIPDGAAAIVVSATIVRPQQKGWLVAYPAGASRPTAATLNWNAGTTRANTATVRVGDGNLIEVYRKDGFGRGGVVIDVVGAFVPAESATSGRLVVPDTAQRLLDTRNDSGSPLGPNSIVRVPLPTGVPADAVALAVNLTVVDTRSNGFFTLFPAGSSRPEASVLNADRQGQIRAAATIVPVTQDGFDLYAMAGAHVIVDMTGWFTGESAEDSDDGLFVPAVPDRLRDTRPETAPIYPDGTISVPLPARAGQPAAVAFSMTMVAPERRGFVTAHAARTPRGATSSGNGMPLEVTAQFGITAASSTGIEFFSSAGTELTVDLLGWFTGPQIPMTEAALAGNPVPTQRVIALGDSTMAGVDRNRAWAQLRGADFDFRARSCARLVRVSCRGREGPIPPPTALDTLRSLPYGFYDVAVIMSGYNEGPSDVAAAVPIIIRAARAKGIRRIIWMTHAREFSFDKGGGITGKQTYALHNSFIRSQASVNHDVYAMEWSRVVRQVPFWLYFDGIHLDKYGGHGAADFISRAVAHVTGQSCPMPQVAGGSTNDVCPNPGFMPAVDIAGLYGV